MINPKVGIIVVTYDSKHYITRCLESVFSQTYSEIKVYVVDNNSKDGTINALLAFPDCTLLAQQENTGYAKGNNIGIKRAFDDGCDAVLLLNPDAYLIKNTLEQLVENISQTSNVGAAQPLICLHPDKQLINSSGNLIHYLGFGYTRDYMKSLTEHDKFSKKDCQIPYASGASVLYTKEALTKTGFLDEKLFLYHEDLDLSWRMRLYGFDIILVPDARAFHEYNFSKSIKKYYYMERNRLIFLLKNFSLRYLILIFPMYVITEFGMTFFSLKNGYFNERLRAYAYFLNHKNRKNLRKARKIIQTQRIVSDKALVPFLTDSILFQDINSSVLTKVGNPLFKLYFRAIKPFI